MACNEPIYLVDGSTYFYRAYHAISPLSNAAGLPTHAIYGFTATLLRVIREKNPRFLAVAFDARGKNFRHELYPAYKANRPPMPDDLARQVPYIKKIVAAYQITALEQEGFEADDLIATAVHRLAGPNQPVVIISADKDLLQLVSPTVSLWDPTGGQVMDPAAVASKYQVLSNQLLDFFALVGDSSDNIPGVVGVGPKTAAKLIGQFGNLDRLYQHLDQVASAKLRDKLAGSRRDALLARELIRLKDDLKLPTTPAAYLRPPADQNQLRELFTELEFLSLIKSELSPAKMAPDKFHLITNLAELRALGKKLATAGDLLVIDTETNSLDPLQAELVGISLATVGPDAWYLPIGHRRADGSPAPGQLPSSEVCRVLKPLLADAGRLKLGHNLKYDLQVLHGCGLTLTPPLADTMIASYLIDPARRSHKLDDLAEELLQFRLTSFAEACDGDKRPDAFAYVEPTTAGHYSCEDVTATRMLWELFKPKLNELDLGSLFFEVEMILLPILARMERVGIMIDSKLLTQLAAEFGEELIRLEEKIHHLAGKEFNINSPRQLEEILFERLKLPHGRKTKGKTGYSTDIKELERLAAYHDLPATVIAQRSLSKLKNTYTDKLTTLIDPTDGRLHTSFNQTVTATGRLSSSHPNLQNIPIHSAEGQRLRAAFIAPANHLFLAADYSQIDLRVLAHYSADPVLLAAFHQGEDIHTRTAAEIFRISPAMITPQMRRVAKTINFGIIYGMSAFGLAEQLRCSRKEAQVFIDRYFALYQGVKDYMISMVEKARRDGFVQTLLKRRRQLPDITSRDKKRRELAERTAINTPIQGTAADIIKLAAIVCERDLRAADHQAEAVVQIHDELIFEVLLAEIEPVGILVRRAMEGVMELHVPLLVNIKTGVNLAAL
ncbi:MAG: DNA polymerase I [Desulfobulbaceae bacterium]|nr:MAG: DNA polymerase I [Desulfobulbaceae bacterium]